MKRSQIVYSLVSALVVALAFHGLSSGAFAGVPESRPSPIAAREFTVVYLRGNVLWRGHVVEGESRVHLRSKPERICRVPGTLTGPWLRIAVSQNGARAAVDPGDQTGLYLVDVRPGAKPRFLRGMQFPTFSPDGSQLAASNIDPADGSAPHRKLVSVLDIQRRHWQTLRAKAECPVWSRNGTEIVMIDDADADPECVGGVLVVDAHTGRLKFSASRAIAPNNPVISPDSRYVGVIHELSRPKMGHFFLDRQTKAPLDRDYDYPNRLPSILTDWSSDSKYALWDWRAPDPNNDGSWLWDEVGVSSIAPGMARWVDIGRDALFSPDARWIGYLHSDRKGIERHHATLCLYPCSGGKRLRLAANVSAFVLAR